jgi:hypothetical protein
MRAPKLRWTAAYLSLALLACGDDGPTGPRPVVLTVISGDNQPGIAGQQLGAPFVVRVTDRRGQPVAGVNVTWTITPGGGAFGDGASLAFEGVFDDDFEEFDQDAHGCLIPAQSVRLTDSDGIAQVRFMPTWFGLVSVTARATGASEPVTFTTDASDPGAVLTIVAGNRHEGKAGEFDEWDFGWHRLEVRLVDGQRNPVPHVPVRWVVTSGDLAMQGCVPGLPPVSNWTRTGSDGIADVIFRLVAVGTSTVAAAVPGVLVSPVTFTVTATGVVINLGDHGSGPTFFGPDFSPDTNVPIGTPVEWMNGFETAQITSTSAPPGGAPFDSGELSQGERFEFVPDVAGTWEYVDQVSGATGTLTARWNT